MRPTSVPVTGGNPTGVPVTGPNPTSIRRRRTRLFRSRATLAGAGSGRPAHALPGVLAYPVVTHSH